MADYTPVEGDYTAKDSLSTGDPDKLLSGAESDAEFSAIQTAVATKYDSVDLATQAQAEAGTSNAVLMTPLRVAQYLVGGGDAGAIGDIIGLTDPDADRIMFWDDSAGAITWLTVATGLTLTGTTLFSDDTAIVLTALSGYDANEHIDHTGVTITAGDGLSYSAGGTDISASATIDLDIDELTELVGAIDITADYVAIYDDSAGAVYKVGVDDLVGDALGDGKWYKGSTQALSAATEATVTYDTEDYDSLERGSFNVSTGEYTVGSTATRLWISAQITVAAQNDDESIEIEVQDDSATVLRNYIWNDSDNDTPEMTVQVSGCISAAASSVIRVRATTSTAETISADTDKSFISIQELG